MQRAAGQAQPASQSTPHKKQKTKVSSTAALKQKHAQQLSQAPQPHSADSTVSSTHTLSTTDGAGADQQPRKRHRSNQERPQELSAAKPTSQLVSLNNTLAQQHITTYKPADPRFTVDSSFNSTMYSRAYKFIDEIKQREIDELKHKVNSKSISETQRVEYKHQLKHLLQLHTQAEQCAQQRAVLQQWKKSERQLQSNGKSPYYLKQSEQKKLLLAQKYMNLKQTGHSAVNKYLEKKQKQSTQTARRHIPQTQ